MSKQYTTNIDQGTRVLRDDELDAVNGAVLGADDMIAIAIAVAGGALIGWYAGYRTGQSNNCGGGNSGTSTKH